MTGRCTDGGAPRARRTRSPPAQRANRALASSIRPLGGWSVAIERSDGPDCPPGGRIVRCALRRPAGRAGPRARRGDRRGPAPELVAPATVSALRCYARERVPNLSERRALLSAGHRRTRPRRWPCPHCERCVAPFDSIEQADWDRLVDANPWSTPFSRWGVHRAWWDAYGANAHEETVVVIPADARPDAPPVGHRPADAPPRGGARRHRAADDDPPPGRPGDHRRPARRQGRVLRRQLPRRLRDAPRGPRRPRPRSPTRSPTTSPTAATRATRIRGTPSTCAVSAAATRPPTPSRAPSGAASATAAGR